jgi:hypothetical protein
MLKRIAFTLVWLVIGLLGTAAIFLAGVFSIYAQVPIKIASGGEVLANLWDRGYVSAEGTWIIEGTKQAFPVQITKITCYKQQGHCTSARAEIGFGDTLSLEVDRFEITKWDATTLVFADTYARCVDYVYTIDRSNLRTFGTRKSKQDADDHCKLMEQRDLKLTLVNGGTVWQSLRGDASARTMPFLLAAMALWWVFVLYRVVRTWRRSAEPTTTTTAEGLSRQHQQPLPAGRGAGRD